MKKSKLSVSLLLSATLLTSLCTNITLSKKAQAATTIRVDPNMQYQTLEGFGANLAWWGNTIGKWPEDKRNEIADLLFSQDGLGINVLRFNIGGGDDPSHNHMNSGSFVNAEMEGYQPSPGVWNWNGDIGEREMLRLAKERGVNIFEAFANSAPYWMTKSGCSAGNTLSLPNFNTKYENDFADYLLAVTEHLKDTIGINFRTIEPFNEPDGFWMAGRPQEGMIVEPWVQKDIINVLKAKIDATQAGIEITANDSWSMDKLADHVNHYDSNAKNAISQFNVHSYSGSDRIGVREYAKTNNKRLWMSEYGTGSGTDLNAISNGLTLANTMISDLRDMKPDAWVYWQPVENIEQRSDSWGFIQARYLDTTYQYTITKQYYTFGQFSKFIKAGYRLIDIDDKNSIAAYDKDSENLVIVAMNNTSNDISNSYNLTNFDSLSEVSNVFRTSSTENIQRKDDISITDKCLNAVLPANSITTFVIPNSNFTPKGTLETINDINYTGDFINGEVNSSAEISFFGTNIELYAKKSPTSGIAAISVDGGPEKYIDLYSSSSKDSTYIYSPSNLSLGNHKIKVRTTGDKNSFSQGTSLQVDYGTAINYTPNKIVILDNDTREISDVKVAVEFYIDDAKHYDYENTGVWDNTKELSLFTEGGKYDGTQWLGDYLANSGSISGDKKIEITQLDYNRPISSARVYVDFWINGERHHDYEDIGPFNGTITLKLNGTGGRYNGTQWVGDFLKK